MNIFLKKITTVSAILLGSVILMSAAHADVEGAVVKPKDIYECGNISTALTDMVGMALEGIARGPERTPEVIQAAAVGYLFMNLENCECAVRFFVKPRDRREALKKCVVRAKLAAEAFNVLAVEQNTLDSLTPDDLGLLNN